MSKTCSISLPADWLCSRSDGAFMRANRAFRGWTGLSEKQFSAARHLADLHRVPTARRFSPISTPLWPSRGKSRRFSCCCAARPGKAFRPSSISRCGAARRRAAAIHVAATRGEGRAYHEAELQRGKQAAEQLAAIVSNSGDAIVSVDPQGYMINANRAFCEIFQYEPTEIAGANMADLIVPDDYRAQYEEKLQEAFLGPSRAQIVQRRRKDGAMIEFSLSTAPIRDETRRRRGDFDDLSRYRAADARRRTHRIPAARGQSPLEEPARRGAGGGAANGAAVVLARQVHRQLYGAAVRDRLQPRSAGLARLARGADHAI